MKIQFLITTPEINLPSLSKAKSLRGTNEIHCKVV